MPVTVVFGKLAKHEVKQNRHRDGNLAPVGSRGANISFEIAICFP